MNNIIYSVKILKKKLIYNQSYIHGDYIMYNTTHEYILYILKYIYSKYF